MESKIRRRKEMGLVPSRGRKWKGRKWVEHQRPPRWNQWCWGIMEQLWALEKRAESQMMPRLQSIEKE